MPGAAVITADATFAAGEDIDENELREYSGRARFIRQAVREGLVRQGSAARISGVCHHVPGYASRLLELFHELRDDRPARGFSYVFGTYSALRVADETGSAVWREDGGGLSTAF
ncbi:MAG: Wadjet anti-phage system protein JetA family protein [Butyricicoccaceae bacterium]